MAYHLCKKEHYVSGKEGAVCPAAGCSAKIGPPISRTEPDPRGDVTGVKPAHGPAACMHVLCREWFPNVAAFNAHVVHCQ